VVPVLELWRQLQPLLPPRARLKAIVLVVESLIAGLLEAIMLVLVVNVALVVAEEDAGGVDLSLPVFGDVTLGTTPSLIAAGACVVLVLLTHLHLSRLTANLAAGTLRGARIRVVRAFANASWARQAQDREGALQETASTLSTQCAAVVMQLGALSVAIVGLIALLFAAFVVDPLVTVVVLVFGVGLFVLLRPIGRITKQRSRRFVRKNSEFTEQMSQWSSLAMDLQVYGVQDVEVDRLLRQNRSISRYMAQSRFMNRAGSFLYKDVALLFLVGAVGALHLVSGVNLSAVGAVVLLIVRALSYAQGANSAMQSVHESSPNLESLLERVASLEASTEPPGHRPLDELTTVTFDRVGYDYEPGRPGIEDVTFQLAAGDAIGIIGPSGGGKSTLVQVLLRLRPPTRGEVRVSDIPYQEIAPASWHHLVALVPQEPRLFQGTVADNIAFLRSDVSREDIERAAADAHVRDDILRLPQGFDTELGPRGAGLSGGQKQRVAIARALAGRPQLLVLDEPTSALDVRSEQLLQETIHDLKGRVTLVIVAHRLTTLGSCDRVIAMRDGHVEMIGTLEEALGHLAFDEDLLDLDAARLRVSPPAPPV
jgi:ATP-binding cassette subfamily B protein